MTQLKDGGRQPRNREERSLSASTVVARRQGSGWDEPCKLRGLRTVLLAAGGEIPPADPARQFWPASMPRRRTAIFWSRNNIATRIPGVCICSTPAHAG